MIFLVILAAVVFLTTVVILARAATRPLTAVDISLSRAEQYRPGQPAGEHHHSPLGASHAS